MEKPSLCLDFHPPVGSSYCLHCGARELTHELRVLALYEYARTVQKLKEVVQVAG